MEKMCVKTAQRPPTRDKHAIRRAPRLLPAQLRRRLTPLHRALRAAIPELDGRSPLELIINSMWEFSTSLILLSSSINSLVLLLLFQSFNFCVPLSNALAILVALA